MGYITGLAAAGFTILQISSIADPQNSQNPCLGMTKDI